MIKCGMQRTRADCPMQWNAVKLPKAYECDKTHQIEYYSNLN